MKGTGVRTHIPSAASAEADTAHHRAAGSPRTQAAAAEGSNHPDPGEDLNAVYLVGESHMGHIIVCTHPEGDSTGPGPVDSSPC